MREIGFSKLAIKGLKLSGLLIVYSLLPEGDLQLD